MNLPADAVRYLAGYLQRGALTLVLGAGVSRGLGLPVWGELVQKSETSVGIPPLPTDRVDSTQLMTRMDAVKRVCQGDFLQLVRSNLYPSEYLKSGKYPLDIIYQPMLIALGAIIMSSRRGSVADVFTLNFDDVLDWYLHLHGFSTQIVSAMPALLSGAVDTRIHHFHGFLPLVEEASGHHPGFDRSRSIVLTRDDLVQRLAETPYAPWPTFISAQLLSKTFLFVGTSMSDMDLAVLLRRALPLVTDREVGFALVATHDATDNMKADLHASHIVPVVVGDYTEIPEFLLEICQIASRGNPA
jgi:hypothetical protein